MPYGQYRGRRRSQHHRNQQSYRRGRRSESDSFWAGSPWPSHSRRGRYRRQGGGVVATLIVLLLLVFLLIHFWWIVIPVFILLVIGVILIVNAVRAKFNPNYQPYKPLKRQKQYYQPDQQGQGQYYQPDNTNQSKPYYQPSQPYQQEPDQYYQPGAKYTPPPQQPSGGHYAVPQSQYPQNPPPQP